MTEIIILDIVKTPIGYILHRRQANYDTDSENESSDDENNLKEQPINNENNLKEQPINDEIINKEQPINNENNSKEQRTNNNLKEQQINTFVKTPDFITKGCTINPNNSNNKFFQYSIKISLYNKEIGKNPQRISNIKPFINNLNWNNINFLPTH